MERPVAVCRVVREKARHPRDKPRIINPQRYKRQQRSQSDQSQIPAETVIGPDGFAPVFDPLYANTHIKESQQARRQQI